MDQQPIANIARICVRAPNWVGDVVMATPALRAVRRAAPSARVTVVIRERVEPVLRDCPWFDGKIVYRPQDRWAPREFLRVSGEVRSGACQLGLILPNSFSSALMFWLGGVERRAGYKRDNRSLLLTDALPRPSERGEFKPTYMADYYLGLCEHVGIPAAGRRTELFYRRSDVAQTRRILADQGIPPGRELFLMHPGAGYGPSKRWPTARFARLAELLEAEYGARVALIAGRAERQTVDRIKDASAADIADLTACGIDLHLLKSVVARSSLLVSTDSGPRHYGIALGIPTVCVMGPTHPDYSTTNLPHDRLVRLDVDCGPCQRKVCPRDHRCMEEISAEQVLEACRDALADSRKAEDD